MIENKKVITGSLIILFLVLAIVYSLMYMKKVNLFKKGFETGATHIITNDTGDTGNQGSHNQIDVPNTSTNEVDLGSQTSSSVDLGDISTQSGVTSSHTQTPIGAESSTSDRPASTNKMLSGTIEYFGVLDIVDILGTSPQFTLQDAKGNYFVYYGDHLNFVQTIQNLGGNVYEMKTETEIIQNQLFGDKVSYINLSQFKDKRVMMVIEIEGDVWLLQVPADQYHYSKDYLQSLFIQ